MRAEYTDIVLPGNIMWSGDDLVVVDTGEAFDNDEKFYWTCFNDVWHPIGEAA
ncbi:MAG: hypothetical protein GY832_37955 [Chloroflexi bacterium]|nr:hypothetical protein [Chloroflexota bacterium]